VEEDGIRCCYHGLKFSNQGVCLEQPCEPEGGRHRSRIRLTSKIPEIGWEYAKAGDSILTYSKRVLEGAAGTWMRIEPGIIPSLLVADGGDPVGVAFDENDRVIRIEARSWRESATDAGSRPETSPAP
jgi:hypothetical protein